MASRKEEKAQRRVEREAAQAAQLAAERAAQRRRRLLWIASGAAVAVVSVILIALPSHQPSKLVDVAQARALTAGLPTHGLTVGAAKAPVNITEYGDLQCPICGAFDRDDLPGVLHQLVQGGKVSFTYRPWPIIGPDSRRGALAALAAARQNRLWPFIDLIYHNQGTENSGYMNDTYLRQVARALGLDVERFDRDRAGQALAAQLLADDSQARQHGFKGTPAFVVRGPHGTTTATGHTDLAGLLKLIAKVM